MLFPFCLRLMRQNISANAIILLLIKAIVGYKVEKYQPGISILIIQKIIRCIAMKHHKDTSLW
jgi:hypothetical protein